MSGFGATIGRLSDRVNPIAVKELRQAVRSRIVTGIFIFFLVVQFAIVALVLLLDESAATSLSAGRGLAAGLYSFMMFVCIVFVPIYTGLRLAWERSDTRRDLMFATTISAGAIIRGKMLTAAMIVALIYSACAPFMVFTYLLRGIDLPTIFTMLGLGALYILGSVQFALFLACIPTSRVAKIFLGLIGLGVILWTAGSFVFASSMMLAGPSFLFFFGPGGGPWAYWGALAFGLILSVLAMGCQYFVSVAILQPPSANRMLPVRIYTTAVWLVAGVVAVVWSRVTADGGPITAWAMTSAVFFIGALLVAVSERETWGPRVRRRIPRFLPARAVAFVFFSGAAGGVLWACLVLGLTLLTLSLVGVYHPALLPVLPGSLGICGGIGGIALYGLAYTLTAGLVRRLLVRLGARLQHYYTWVLALMLATVGSVAPLLVFLILAYGSGDGSHLVLESSPLTYLNPIYLSESSGREARLLFVGIWAVVVTVASVPWFIRQVRAFRPLRPGPAPAPDGARHG